MSGTLHNIFHKLSVNDEVTELLNNLVIYENVIGFVGIGRSGNTTIACNVAYALSNYSQLFKNKTISGIRVCLVDLNVFYPKVCSLFGVKYPKKGSGLLPTLKGDPIGDNIIKISESLEILSPSSDDNFEDYYDIEDWQLDEVLEELRHSYDIVILDIPNDIPMIYCYTAIKNVDKLFITRSEDLMSDKYIKKFMDYFFVRGRFNCSRYLVMNIRTNSAFDDNIVTMFAKKNNLKLMGIINFEQEVINSETRGNIFLSTMYVTDSFKDTIKNILYEILPEELTGKKQYTNKLVAEDKPKKKGLFGFLSKKDKQKESDKETLKKRIEDNE